WDGKPIDSIFTFRTLGISMDHVVSLLQLDPPDFIKMDVDGIEHIILRGGSQVLSKTRGILVEINDGVKAQEEESRKILQEAGLTLQAKLHSPMMENSAYATVYNQIWERN
ncbi:MAG: FkbM family methyltransferase, partial [Chlamydiae bacterium]|nr:FkbM family methyltransferase [Chlamydiota bacterium]